MRKSYAREGQTDQPSSWQQAASEDLALNVRPGADRVGGKNTAHNQTQGLLLHSGLANIDIWDQA